MFCLSYLCCKASVRWGGYTYHLSIILIALFAFPNDAMAHLPYAKEDGRMIPPNGTPLYVVRWYGDGLIWQDPAVGVIMDASGHVYAHTPVAQEVITICANLRIIAEQFGKRLVFFQ